MQQAENPDRKTRNKAPSTTHTRNAIFPTYHFFDLLKCLLEGLSHRWTRESSPRGLKAVISICETGRVKRIPDKGTANTGRLWSENVGQKCVHSLFLASGAGSKNLGDDEAPRSILQGLDRPSGAHRAKLYRRSGAGLSVVEVEPNHCCFSRSFCHSAPSHTDNEPVKNTGLATSNGS